jgi:serine/threonine protein kinase
VWFQPVPESYGRGRPVFLDNDEAVQLIPECDHDDGQIVAKRHAPFTSVPEQVSFCHDLELLVNLRHPCLLRVDAFTFMPFNANPRLSPENRLSPMSLTAYHENGSLEQRFGSLTPLVCSKVMFGVVGGMAYLHGNGVIHRNLKPSTIVFDANFDPLITDYGISRHWSQSDLYKAPEQFFNEISPKYDVFSFAVIVNRMFCGATALTDGTTTDDESWIGKVESGLRLPQEGVPPPIAALVRRCWAKEPEDRPTFGDLVLEFRANHDWLAPGTDESAIAEYEARVCVEIQTVAPVPSLFGHLWVSASDYEIIRCLGEGASARTFLSRQMDTGQEVAQKIFNDRAMPVNFRMFFSELEIQSKFDHPTILKVIGFSLNDEGRPIIFLEFMPNESLLSLRRRSPSVVDATRLSVAIFGIAVAMRELHRQGILYYDMKFDNVFMDRDFEPKLGDFGVSEVMTTVIPHFGCPVIMPPELIVMEDDFPRDTIVKTDTFSFAVVTVAMLQMELVMDDGVVCRNLMTQLNRIARGMRYLRPDGISDALWNLVVRCWAQDRDDRPFTADIVQELLGSDDWVFEGTDLERLHAYQRRVG